MCSQSSNFIKKRLAQVFSCEFCESFKNTFFIELLRTTPSISCRFITLKQEIPIGAYSDTAKIKQEKQIVLAVEKWTQYLLLWLKYQSAREASPIQLLWATARLQSHQARIQEGGPGGSEFRAFLKSRLYPQILKLIQKKRFEKSV